jgi:hypothetical protein
MPTTEKISVTLGRAELRGAKRLASRLGLSLSTFITDAVRRRIEDQDRLEAGLEVLATFDPLERASPAEMKALLELWTKPSRTPSRARSRTGRRPSRRA